MSVQKNEQEAKLMRGRKDKTLNVEVSKRRLDTLARLLAGRSICTAVMLLKEKLYIAANEIVFSKEKNKKDVATIEKIIKYFSIVARLQLTSKEKEEDRKIFQEEIFPKGRLGKNNITMSISDDLFKDVLDQILNNQDLSIHHCVQNLSPNSQNSLKIALKATIDLRWWNLA